PPSGRGGQDSLMVSASPIQRPRRSELSDRALGLIMLAPMTLVLVLLIGYPLVSSFVLSLHRANLANPEQGQPFIGLGNYLFAFRQPEFWYAVERTFYFTIVSVGIELALGIVFADRKSV